MNSPNLPTESAWRVELADAYSRIEDLLTFLELPNREQGRAGLFPFRVTYSYAARMNKGDPSDPLLRQVLPLPEEWEQQDGFIADPVGDRQAVAVPGLLHKYHGRALLITTGACAIHCRYCFRREFPYGEAQLSRSREAQALEHIAADDSIAEVILSGGDPLVLDDERLAELVGKIEAISHVQRLRIHTRLPVVLPSRTTARMVDILASTRLNPVVVIHANHANELDTEVGRALDKLSQAGIVLLNQTVLLKGVNDTPGALSALSERLFELGVLPYYLHLLDKVRGAAHFDLPEASALALYDDLRRHLPGYLVPRLVRESAGEPYKTLVPPSLPERLGL
ncbi:MAG: EF-P beta-lysylation protein EpmB [Methylococcaceae bacterium]|nr:EF-P beta-lysylation protein EpmB [Methylococcaceae bacterium]